MAESTLEQRLTEQRASVIPACAQLVRRQVDQKRGLTGAGIKTALKVVTAVRPTFIEDVVERLLPEFARALEDSYAKSVTQANLQASSIGTAFQSELKSSPNAAADALLRVTDDRVAGAAPTIKKVYERLRGSAKSHVEAAVPDLADTLAAFL